MTRQTDLSNVTEQVKEVHGRQLPRYPTYKPSGLQWLGDIPKHWTVRKLKFIADIQTRNVDKNSVEGEEPVRLCNYIDVYHHEYITADMDFMSATATREEIKRFPVRIGDVLITKDSEEWDDIAVSAFVSEPLDGALCGYHLAQIRPFSRQADGEYLFRAFASHALRDQFRVRANGITRYGLSRDAIASAWFVLPPVEEQRCIAKFLRQETAEIDRLIAKKQRMIELLKEKRAALIRHVVTKGLDPAVAMKPSGIDWLGEIPAHWGVKRFGVIASVVRGASPRPAGDPTFFFGDHIPWITVGDVTKDANMLLTSTETMLTPQGRMRSRVFNKGTLVLTNSGATLGVPKVLAIQGCANDGIVGFESVSSESCLEYLYFFLCSLTAVFRDRIKQGCGQPNLNTGIVSRTPVLTPPYDEQLRIVEHVSRETEDIDRLADRIESASGGLGEYRSALISAAVTGKIDVRREVV